MGLNTTKHYENEHEPTEITYADCGRWMINTLKALNYEVAQANYFEHCIRKAVA